MTSSVAPDTNRVVFKGWLPAQEAADFMGVSREYVYRLKSIYDEGGAGIPGFMLGDSSRVLMFRESDLRAYMKAHPDLAKNRSGRSSEPGEEDDDDDEGDEAEEPVAS